MARSVAARRRAFLMVACLAGVTACGPLASTTDSGARSLLPDEPELGVVSQVTDPRQIALPVDAYVQSRRERARVEEAERLLVEQCMRRFGFSFDLPSVDRDPADLENGDKPNYSGLYGLLDESQAATNGYHAHVGPQPRPAELDGNVTQLSEEQLSGEEEADSLRVGMGYPSGGTFRGQQIPNGGCSGEARRAVAAGAPAFDPLINEAIMADAWPAAESDSRSVAAAAAWSACMAGEGYDYRDPMEANDDSRWYRSDWPTETEIAVAVADVRCKKTTNYVGIRMAVDSAYQLRAMAQRAHDLANARAGHQRQLRNATRVLTAN